MLRNNGVGIVNVDDKYGEKFILKKKMEITIIFL